MLIFCKIGLSVIVFVVRFVKIGVTGVASFGVVFTMEATSVLGAIFSCLTGVLGSSCFFPTCGLAGATSFLFFLST